MKERCKKQQKKKKTKAERSNGNRSYSERVRDSSFSYFRKSLTVPLLYYSQSQVIVERRETSRDKLIDLWINKRSKAIQVIKNDGYWSQQNRDEIPLNFTMNS